MTSGALAFVDDSPMFIEQMESWQIENGLPPLATTEIDRALSWVREGRVRHLAADLRMPGRSGLSVVEEAREIRPGITVEVLTAHEPTEEEEEEAKQLNVPIRQKETRLSSLLQSFEPSSLGASDPPDRFEERIEQLEAEVLKLTSKVGTLELLHEEWVADLVGSLERIPNASEALVASAEEEFTVAELIEDIRLASPRGVRHIRLWRSALRKLAALPGPRE